MRPVTPEGPGKRCARNTCPTYSYGPEKAVYLGRWKRKATSDFFVLVRTCGNDKERGRLRKESRAVCQPVEHDKDTQEEYKSWSSSLCVCVCFCCAGWFSLLCRMVRGSGRQRTEGRACSCELPSTAHHKVEHSLSPL